MNEAHNTPYSIRSGNHKMHKDLHQKYGLNKMKKDVADYVSYCLTYQKVKFVHRRIVGELQSLVLLQWK